MLVQIVTVTSLLWYRVFLADVIYAVLVATQALVIGNAMIAVIHVPFVEPTAAMMIPMNANTQKKFTRI